VAALPKPPDLYLWVDPAGRYFPKGIEDLPLPTACYLIDVHLGTWRRRVAQFFDIVFVAQKNYLEFYRRIVGHDQVYWLPLAAAPDVHRRLELPKIYDVGFVGNLSLAHQKTARARRLRLIASRFRTNDFYRQYTPEEVGQVYSQSHIVFNTSIAGDVNMRVFEGTAAGALVLTDSVGNGLGDLFEIGREIVVYRDDAELLEKIAYYLTHQEEREEIACAGYRRTHAQHTYAHRVRTVLEVTAVSALERLAPMRHASRNERTIARQEIYTHLHMVDALLDEARDLGYTPLRRAWVAWPVLARRLLR